MAEVKLNTTTSIVDYLRSIGKPSDFTSRSSLYKTSGLEGRLGKYVGSATQNTAFLRQLSTPAPSPVTAPPTVDTGATGGFSTGATAATNNTPSPVYASDVLKNLGYQSKTTDQIAQEALEAPAFKLYQEKAGIKQLGDLGKAEADKARLATEAASKTKEVNESFGRRGLFFSGMRAEDIQGIAAGLAASQLGVDRALAEKLLTADVDTRKEFLDQVTKIVEDASKGRKEALDILEKQGLTIGLDGKTLVPTLSALSGMRAEETLRISQERLRLAEESGLRAERALSLREGEGGTGGGFTKTQINTGAANAALPIEEFRALPEDIKNFYISNQKQSTWFNEKVVGLRTGTETLKDIKRSITELSVSPVVREHLDQRLLELFPNEPENISFLNKLWETAARALGVMYGGGAK